jgi:hypothetical protein
MGKTKLAYVYRIPIKTRLSNENERNLCLKLTPLQTVQFSCQLLKKNFHLDKEYCHDRLPLPWHRLPPMLKPNKTKKTNKQTTQPNP